MQAQPYVRLQEKQQRWALSETSSGKAAQAEAWKRSWGTTSGSTALSSHTGEQGPDSSLIRSRRLPPTGRLSLPQVGEATGQVSYMAFSQHETSTRLLGEQEACRGGSGPEGLRTGICAQVWAFLLFSQSAYCTNQVGFGKKAVEVIKWVERCKHAENLKQFFSKVPNFSTICKEHSPMWTFKVSFPKG